MVVGFQCLDIVFCENIDVGKLIIDRCLLLHFSVKKIYFFDKDFSGI